MRKSSTNGSVTLEAALVMPSFLILAFLLLFLLKTSLIAMTLHGALSQATKLSASVWYPISLMQADHRAEDSLAGSPESASGFAKADVLSTLGALGRWLPAPLGDYAQQLADGQWSLEAEAAKLILGRLVQQLADPAVLDPERMRITAVKLPAKNDVAHAFISVEAEYRLPFRIPWEDQPITIRMSASERAWVGGSPSKAALAEPGEHDGSISFVSMEPNPARPGHKVTLMLRTNPGAALDLTVVYKSGKSQAKHLGRAVADEAGYVSWTWHVSGNTTSGEWTWVARTDDGASFTQSFQVARKTD